MALFLSEKDVEGLLTMEDAISAVEEAFRREAGGEATNSPRTRSRAKGAALNVMHAVLPYLGRGGLKAYMSTEAGTRFVVVLLDLKDSVPLAVMGADFLGRYRTGAASGVATRHLYHEPSARLAVFGSGRQALTQVLAVSSVKKVEEVRVWSPDRAHRERFANGLSERGFAARAFGEPGEAARGAELGSAITSAREPYLSRSDVAGFSHLNLCGGNNPEHSEISPDGVGVFTTVAVDDVAQGKSEYGDLIRAAAAGTFQWDGAIELSKVVAGGQVPKGRTLFKSGGVAIEDVAVASLIYDRALKSGRYASSSFELV